MNNKIVITGANRGIGLELSRSYQKKGAEVIAVCRSSSNELDTLNIKIIDNIDVTQKGSVNALKNRLTGINIDILINNAGILSNETIGNMDFDKIYRQFDVNAVGPLRITSALLDNLVEGSKIALMTSRLGSMADNTSGAYYGYRMSKAALNAAGKSLANDLMSRKIAVGIFHPGYVKTGMTNFSGDMLPEDVAELLIQRIDELNMDNTGTFWHANGEVLPW